MKSSFHRRRQKWLSGVAALPIALAGGAVALSVFALQARAEDAQVDEVTITARDRAEKAQDVPLPISTIGQKTSTREHVESWRDVIQRVPSFTPAIANPRTGANGLRGITGISGGADGSEGDVGLIVDNVFYTYIGFSWFTQYDIESLQIARGPQGTLLGKNTTTGAIIINTNPPSFTPQTTTETSFGSRRFAEEKFTTTGPLIPDTLAYRVSIFGAKQDGWLPNLYGPTEPKGQDTNRWGARIQLLGTVENITDRFIYEHLASAETNNATPTWNDGWTTNFNGLPRSISATNALGVKQTFQTPQQALAYLYPTMASRFQPYYFNTVYTNFGNVDTHTNGASNELNWLIGDYNLTSVSAWRHFDFHPNNSDGNYGLYQYQNDITGYDVGANQYSQELRLSSPIGGPIDWTIGSYFLRETITSNSRRQFGQDAVALLQKNVTGKGLNNPAILTGVESDLYGQAGITTFAQFGQLNYHYDEKTTITFGVRNSWEDRTSSDTGFYFGGATLPANLTNVRTNYVISETGGTNFYLPGEQKTDSISFLINPSYKFNDNVTGYLFVGRGVKSGAANTAAVPLYYTNTSFNTNNQVYPIVGYMPPITQPEVSLDYEIGFKSQWWDNKLQVNANAYWNDIYNFQAVLNQNYTFVDSSGNTNIVSKSYLGNIPQVRLMGVELDGRYSPLENLWINVAAAYNGAWYISYPNATPPADYSAAYPTAQLNLAGVTILNVTPYSFGIGANYEYSVGSYFGESIKGYVWGNQFFKSLTYFSLGPAYTRYVLEQGSYSIFNAGFGFKTADEKYDISVWAKNLFDRRAMNSQALSTSGTTLAYGTVTWVDPLTVGATLRTKF
ncbi:TonB-dependent receptor [Rhodoblastus sp.]|uniref:TonB-dependent receptor n=1 Tax=Rhodoblastus sp. TaxID=1962975 RepID=UPI0035B38146